MRDLNEPLQAIISKTDDGAMKRAIVEVVGKKSSVPAIAQAALLPTGDRQLDTDIVDALATYYAIDAEELETSAEEDGQLIGEKVLQAAKALEANWSALGQYTIDVQRERDMALVPVVLSLLVRGPGGTVRLAKEREKVTLTGGSKGRWSVAGTTDGSEIRFPLQAFGLTELAKRLGKEGGSDFRVPGFDEIDAEVIKRNRAEAKTLIAGELVFAATAADGLEAILWGAKVTLERPQKPG